MQRLQNNQRLRLPTIEPYSQDSTCCTSARSRAHRWLARCCRSYFLLAFAYTLPPRVRNTGDGAKLFDFLKKPSNSNIDAVQPPK